MNAESLCVPRDQPEKEREGEGEREREREKELTQGNQAFVELVCHFIFQGSFYTLTCT